MSERSEQQAKYRADAILQDERFLAELQVLAAESGKSLPKTRKYAAKCLREIAADPRESWLRPAAAMARFIYTRSYEAELDINTEALEELRTLAKDHLLLFLWSHKSHMDSFVFLLSLYENRFRPPPLIFAGVNMNFLGFGTLARRVGAIFLRRSFQDDPVYRLVFLHYIDSLIANRIPLSWSIEGTRSRTGKLSPPKLGILNWVVESSLRQNLDNVMLVPVSIAFDRIAEIDDYTAIQQGQAKKKESLRWFLDFIFGMKTPNGRIYVRYAEPLPLNASTSLSASVAEEQGDAQRAQVTRLAFEVCTRIEQATPIKSADVLSMVLLGANRRALTASEIEQQATDFAALIRERELPSSSALRLENYADVQTALLAMKQDGLVEIYAKGDTPIYYIPDGKYLAAAYYRNTITHYFLSSAFGELGLASCALDIRSPSRESLREEVLALRDLYKFEFFYRPTDEFWEDLTRKMDRRYAGWDSPQQSIQKLLRENPPRFGHAILRSITEAYLIIATGLLDMGAEPAVNDKKLMTRLQAQGQQLLLRRSISCEAATSRDLLANGLRQAEHKGLLEGDAAELPALREAFAARVVSTLSAINLLQRCYDSAWFSQLTPGGAERLLES